MSTLQRLGIQIAAGAVVVLALLAEVLHVVGVRPGEIVWQVVFPPTAPWPSVLANILPGSTFVLAGLVAWFLRPANRVGVLMTLVGVGLLVGASPNYQSEAALASTLSVVLVPWAKAVLLTLRLVVGALTVVVLIHLLLAFPGGRLTTPVDRVVVRLLYIVVPVAGLIAAIGSTGQIPFFGSAGINVFGLSIAIPNAVYLGCLVGGSVLVMQRWLLGGRARRRSMGPIVLSLLPVTIAFVPWTVISVASLIWSTPTLHATLGLVWDNAHLSPLLLVVLPIVFLAGLLRSGLDMSSVGGLVIKLSGGLLPDQLQPALQQALNDPSLQVAYWLPELDSFADESGTPIGLPGPDSERTASVLGDQATPIAALIYDSSLDLEGDLVSTAAAAVRMALENARLQVQLRAQLEDVRQSRARLVEAADTERQRVERNLHDGAQQQLVTLLLAMQVAKDEATRRRDKAVAKMIDANIVTLKEALSELRELARGLHPAILTEAGLVPAIKSLAERSPILVDVSGDFGATRLAPPMEAALYYVISEAITNAVKHSLARHVTVSLSRLDGTASVSVTDDGVGGADPSRGSGLRGLTDRISAVGGVLKVESGEGTGTRVRAEVPCL